MFCNKYSRHNRRGVFLMIVLFLIGTVIYQNYFSTVPVRFPISVQETKTNSSFHPEWKKAQISHYTPLYGRRMDASSNVFDDRLKEICEIIEPEKYMFADAVIASIVDLTDLPRLSNGSSYREVHSSQFWLFYAEESPRNSYHSKNIPDLDGWFDFSATLRSESDFPIQYRGYRIKPSIGILLQQKFNIVLNQTSILSDFKLEIDSTSSYVNKFSSLLYEKYLDEQNRSMTRCPFGCNQPLPSNLTDLISPFLPKLTLNSTNRDVVYIAWFVSNCNTHSRREDYVRQLRSQTGIRVDIYGDCSSTFHKPIVSNLCRKGSPNCMEQILTHYRFYLSFENSKCDDYITEKYWIQGLNQHAVPVVFGAKKRQYERIAVPNSFLHVDDYATVEDLARDLHRLNRDDNEYLKYLRWTQIYDVSPEYGFGTIQQIHTGLCLVVHEQHLKMINRTLPTPSLDQIHFIINKLLHLNHISLSIRKRINLTQFYNPDKQCWDSNYPSLIKQMYNHLFAWWTLF